MTLSDLQGHLSCFMSDVNILSFSGLSVELILCHTMDFDSPLTTRRCDVYVCTGSVGGSYKTVDDKCHHFGRPSQWHDMVHDIVSS